MSEPITQPRPTEPPTRTTPIENTPTLAVEIQPTATPAPGPLESPTLPDARRRTPNLDAQRAPVSAPQSAQPTAASVTPDLAPASTSQDTVGARLQAIPRLKRRVSLRSQSQAIGATPAAQPSTAQPQSGSARSRRGAADHGGASARLPSIPASPPARSTLSGADAAQNVAGASGGAHDPLASGGATTTADAADRRLMWQGRNPRVLAALCYALPFVMSGATLLGLVGAPRNRFVRLHAAQSLILFVLMGLAQVALLVALVTLGALAPAAGWPTVALGLAFYALVVALGVLCLVLWLRLIRDCMQGRWRRYPALTPLATHLERATRRRIAGRARQPASAN